MFKCGWWVKRSIGDIGLGGVVRATEEEEPECPWEEGPIVEDIWCTLLDKVEPEMDVGEGKAQEDKASAWLHNRDLKQTTHRSPAVGCETQTYAGNE